jgi:hypothetical protein
MRPPSTIGGVAEPAQPSAPCVVRPKPGETSRLAPEAGHRLAPRPETAILCPMSPTVLRIGRYRFFFFSNEGHEPPHVHVQDGNNLAKFWLEPVELARSTGYPPRELTRVHALVVEHRHSLLEAWHEFFGS